MQRHSVGDWFMLKIPHQSKSVRDSFIFASKSGCRRSHPVLIAARRWPFVGMILALSLILVAGTAQAKVDYTFEGRLLVELENGQTEPISGAQVRVKRAGGTGAGRKHVETGSEGHFNGTWKFLRDKNGGLPGNNPINFTVQVRLRDADLKIRKGGWFNNNWITVATPQEKGGGRFPLDEITIDSGKPQKLAALWWAHQEVLQILDKHDVGLPKKLTVIYPNKFVFKPNADFYILKVRLTEERWRVDKTGNTEVVIHEVMHQWDVNHMKGAKSLLCMADAHHKSPDRWASSRCSGFMEGFAEATAQQINHTLFGDSEPEPETMADLRNGNVCYDVKDEAHYPINNMAEAQQSDCGWENFFTFVMAEDKFANFGSADRSCKPTTVPKWQLLKVLKAEAPRKANWFRGKATFTWMTDILQRQVDGFDSWDARYYTRLADPSSRLSEIQNDMCDSRHSARQTVVIDGSDTSGGTDYTLQGGGQIEAVSGQLEGHQVSIQSNDQVSGNSAQGHVGQGRDGYRVSGDLPRISLTSPVNADIYVNGRPYHAIIIDGSAASGGTDYTLHAGDSLRQVSGQLNGHSVSIQSDDQVNGQTATGRVVAGKDGFISVGELPRISLKNPANADVSVNGLYYHTVVIDGSAASGGTDYTLSNGVRVSQVKGSLAGHDVTIQSDDNVNNGSAEGHVGAGKDGFIVLGPKPSITLEQPAHAKVYINGRQR